MSPLHNRKLYLPVVLLLLLAGGDCFAQPESSRYVIEERKALIIGNNAYSTAPLKNPANDATAVAKTLSGLGFQVNVAIDVDLRRMETEIDKFIASLHPGTIAMFYYAGHGIQMDGENYLIPTDFVARDAADVRYSSYSASRLLDRMELTGTKLNIIVLDACRNNPFLPFRSGSRGLAIMTTGQGTYIAYATSPGKTASDNPLAQNGLFTGCFLETLKEPGLNLDQVFSKVREQVAIASKRNQIPWTATSVIGEFYFHAASLSEAIPPKIVNDLHDLHTVPDPVAPLIPGVAFSKIPQDMIEKIRIIKAAGEVIQYVALGSNNTWVLFTDKFLYNNVSAEFDNKVREVSNAKEIIQHVALGPNGTWVLFTNKFLHSHVSTEFGNKVREITNAGERIQNVALGPNGTWALFTDKFLHNKTFVEFDNKLREISNAKETIQQVALGSSSTWVLFTDKFLYSNVSVEFGKKLREISNVKEPIQKIALGPDGNWIIVIR